MTEENIEALQTQAKHNHSEVIRLTAAHVELSAKHREAVAELEAVRTELAESKKDFTKKCNAAVQQAMCGHGVPPVSMGFEESPGGHENPVRGLKGLARATALHRAEMEGKE